MSGFGAESPSFGVTMPGFGASNLHFLVAALCF